MAKKPTSEGAAKTGAPKTRSPLPQAASAHDTFWDSKMALDRNPDNFFAETEQAAFHPGHIVPGIDFTNDPLLQGRLFSYTDTQLSRLGGAKFPRASGQPSAVSYAQLPA